MILKENETRIPGQSYLVLNIPQKMVDNKSIKI